MISTPEPKEEISDFTVLTYLDILAEDLKTREKAGEPLRSGRATLRIEHDPKDFMVAAERTIRLIKVLRARHPYYRTHFGEERLTRAYRRLLQEDVCLMQV